MKITYPERPEGQVWHQQFQKHLMQWLQSQREDSTAFDEALDALRNQMEREPKTAGFVANLISTLARQHSEILPATQLERLAKRGLDAVRLVGEPSALRSLTQCSLLNHLARAYISLRRAGEALEQIELSLRSLEEGPLQEDTSADLFRCQAQVLAGHASEDLLDYESALEHFDAANDIAGAIVTSEERMAQALTAVINLDYPNMHPPEEAIKAQIQLLWRSLSEVRIAASAGAGRCAVQVDRGSVDERLLNIADVSEINGLDDITPMALAVQVAVASYDVAADVTERLLSAAEKLDLAVCEFGAVLNAALSTNTSSADQRAECIELAEDFLEEVEDPIIRAATFGFLLISGPSGTIDEDYLYPFLEELDALDYINDERMAYPENRVVFDEPVLAALLEMCGSGDGELPWDVEDRKLLAKLIDYDFVRHTPLDDWLPYAAMDYDHERIRDLLRDRLARAQTALEEWPDTLLLILRTLHDRTLFIALSGENTPKAIIAEANYSQNAKILVDHLGEEIGSIRRFGSPGPVETLKKHAQNAFQSLPAMIRELIEQADRLLICPDHRASGGSVPFETFHDNDGWLGINKDISRFPNLRTVVRCLERTSHRDNHKRLLSVGLPNADESRPLRFAASEADTVRKTLEAVGWDAPQIEEDRVSPDFLLERLPYATHLHIATHGEAEGQNEALVLTENQKLSGAALLGRFVPTMPTAYVNACVLGKSRWAGSGRTQSIPYALLGSGCPAVLANLLPVEDQASSELAVAFYEHALDTDFGSSLMAARGGMEKNLHPVFWGTTVLFGDPGTSLVETEGPVATDSERYLNGIHPVRNNDLDTDIQSDLQSRLMSTPDDVRLVAAIEFARVIETWQSDPPNYDTSDVCALCHVAYDLDHAAWLAFLVYMAHKAMDDELGLEEKIRFYDNAIRLVEPLGHEDNLWSQILDQLLVAWLHAVRGERVPVLQAHGPQADDQEDFVAAVQAMTDIQLAMEAKAIREGKGPVARAEENTTEDVLWNAVMASRDYQFEGMQELYEYSATIVEKLIQHGALPDQSRDEASTAFAGMLNWLWRSQNQVLLDTEMIAGQTGVLQLLVDSLDATWEHSAWFKPFKQFAVNMKSALDSLEGLPYDDKLYPRIEEVMTQIKAAAEEALSVTEEQHPEHICAATAWVLGSLIQYNTYSYVDGSVPEDIEAKLRDIQYGLDASSEGRFYPWLDTGFKAVREADYDELQRWKYDFGDQQVEDAAAL